VIAVNSLRVRLLAGAVVWISLALVVAGRRLITNPGSSIGATNTNPFVLKYTVWPDIGWRLPSRSTTVSGGWKIEPTVSDALSPDTMVRPARGPFRLPHANVAAHPTNATVTRIFGMDHLPDLYPSDGRHQQCRSRGSRDYRAMQCDVGLVIGTTCPSLKASLGCMVLRSCNKALACVAPTRRTE